MRDETFRGRADSVPSVWVALCKAHAEVVSARGDDGGYCDFPADEDYKQTCDFEGCTETATVEFYPGLARFSGGR